MVVQQRVAWQYAVILGVKTVKGLILTNCQSDKLYKVLQKHFGGENDMIQESMINYLSDILKDAMEFTSSYMKWSEGLLTVVKWTKLIAYVGLMLKST